MRFSLDSLPTKLSTKLSATIAPQWWPRALLVRRTLALVAIAASITLAAWPDSASASRSVVVATHDLRPGQQLSTADLRLQAAPTSTVSTGALDTIDQARGRVLSGAARAGEVLTDLRLVGPELLAETGNDRTAVPLRLSDAAVADLLHPGSRVDIVGADRQTMQAPEAHVLASDATVLTIRRTEENKLTGKGDNDQLVVVSLPSPQATQVASASLRQDVTITLR